LNASFAGRIPGSRIRTSAGLKRHRLDLMHYVWSGERCPAAEAWPTIPTGAGLTCASLKTIVAKKPNVRNAARDGFGSRGPLFRSFAVSKCALGSDE
jgi:hypothetical protein